MKINTKQETEGRTMPARKAKKSVLHAVEKLPISKLDRKTSKIGMSSSSSKGGEKPNAAKLRLLYTKRDLGKFRPTLLETIPEETSESNENPQPFGIRKLRRSVVFTSGKHPTKLIQRLRRSKIKKYFGRMKRNKKISMAHFLERFKNASEKNELDETGNNAAEKCPE